MSWGGSGFRFRAKHGNAGAALIFLAIGVIGLLVHLGSATPGNETGHATGTVAGFSTSYGRHGETCTPYADFTVNGKSYVAHGKLGTSGACSTMGDAVPVRYDPSDPSQASIPATGLDAVYPWLMILAGVVGFAVLVVNHARMRKRWT